MSLRFMDSFDHYVTADLTEKWTTLSSMQISTGNGRRGTAALYFYLFSSAYLRKTLDAQATWIVGCAFRWGGESGTIMALGDNGVDQVALYVNANGTLAVNRAGTVLGTSSFALAAGQYAFVEFKATLHNTSGSFEVRVDGITRLSGNNVDTQNTANASADQIGMGSRFGSSNGAANSYLDDLYVCDGTGSSNNTFLGDCRVDSYLPTADGAHTGLTPSSGTTHYLLVDEASPNDDTDTNESATLGAKDTYGFADIAHDPASIFGVQINLNVKKDDAGFRQVKDVVRSGGTDYPGAAQAVSTSYGYKSAIREVDPATGAPWTQAAVNSAEFGMEVA